MGGRKHKPWLFKLLKIWAAASLILIVLLGISTCESREGSDPARFLREIAYAILIPPAFMLFLAGMGSVVCAILSLIRPQDYSPKLSIVLGLVGWFFTVLAAVFALLNPGSGGPAAVGHHGVETSLFGGAYRRTITVEVIQGGGHEGAAVVAGMLGLVGLICLISSFVGFLRLRRRRADTLADPELD